MTDTTDIKALREQAESIMNLLDNLAGFEPQDIDMDAVELRFEDENGVDTGCDISIVDTAQQSAGIIRALLDHLEAECQRADEATRVIDQRNGECDRLINDIEATQVALNISRHDLKRQTELKEKALDDACTATQASDRWMSRALSAEQQLLALRDALKALDNFTGSL